MANLKFIRKATRPASADLGTICFTKDTRAISVYTDAGWEDYSGIINATVAENVLTLTKADGSTVTYDFSDFASATAVATELNKKLNTADQVVKSVSTTASAGVALVKDANGALSVSVTPGTVTANNTSVVTGGAVQAAIAEATKDIATSDTVSTLSEKVEAIENDYLTSKDKTELSNAISAEETRATGVETGLRTDVDAIKADYLKTADKTALQNSIDLKADKTALESLSTTVAGNTALINSILENEDETNLNSIAELAAWIEEHGAEASEMTASINKNASDISTINTTIDDLKQSDEATESRLDALEAKNSTIDSALQASDITTGSANGTISVKGGSVAVYGLGSAAYTESSAYDAAGAASAVLGTSSDTSDAATVYGVKAYVKEYADSLMTWAEFDVE